MDIFSGVPKKFPLQFRRISADVLVNFVQAIDCLFSDDDDNDAIACIVAGVS